MKKFTVDSEVKPVVGILSALLIMIVAAIIFVSAAGCSPKYGCQGNYQMSGYHPKNK